MKKYLTAMIALAMGASATAQQAGSSPTPLVAIASMDDPARTGIADSLSTMLETSIISTGKFRVIERSRLGRLEAEQANARAGRVTSNRPDRRGGFEGVDYLIYGSITGVSRQNRSDLGSSLMSGLLGNRGATCSRSSVALNLDLRITDADTGEVKLATSIAETGQSAATCDAQGQVDTGALTRAAANRIARQLVTTIYPVSVAAVQPDGTVVLNYGSDVLNMGDRMVVFAPGDVIRDPTTGRVIDRMEGAVHGIYEITQQTVRTSRARAITPVASTPAVGSLARSASPDELRSADRRQRR